MIRRQLPDGAPAWLLNPFYAAGNIYLSNLTDIFAAHASEDARVDVFTSQIIHQIIYGPKEGNHGALLVCREVPDHLG